MRKSGQCRSLRFDESTDCRAKIPVYSANSNLLEPAALTSEMFPTSKFLFEQQYFSNMELSARRVLIYDTAGIVKNLVLIITVLHLSRFDAGWH